MWNRGSQIDNWQVKEWWNFSKSGGAVSATWLAGTREVCDMRHLQRFGWLIANSGLPHYRERQPAFLPEVRLLQPQIQR